MKKSDEMYMVHDDRDRYDVSQLTPEEYELYLSMPDISDETMKRFLMESMK